MDHNEFQKLAVRTEAVVDDIKLSAHDLKAFTSALSAYIAISSILDMYKKNIFYGTPINHKTMHDFLEVASSEMELVSADIDSSTSNPMEPIGIDPKIFHALLGTITEHGEIAQALETGILLGELDLVNVCEEIGDSDWYKALFFESTQISWVDVRSMIIKKLEIRYADKIFSVEEAESRNLESEREALNESIEAAVDKFYETTD